MGAAAETPDPSARSSTQTILVVDDEVLIRTPVADFLRDCGFRVLEAGDGAQAVQLLQAMPDIDLVFSDVEMPGMNGFDLATWVRQNRPGLVVVLTSGVAQFANQAKNICKTGGPRFLHKPYVFTDLERQIRELLNAARRMP